jgi:hypothetical protein
MKFIQHDRIPSSGARSEGLEIKVKVPDILTAANNPLTEAGVQGSEEKGEFYVKVDPLGSEYRPIAATELTQDEVSHTTQPMTPEDSQEHPEAFMEDSPKGMEVSEEDIHSVGMSRVGGLTGPNGRPYQKGNKAARGRKPKLAMIGVDVALLDIKDSRYTSALRRAEYYLKRRSRELSVMFGYASAGVNGILSSASLQLAASKYLAQRASEMAGVDMKVFTELMKLSMQLQNSARTNELAAYELCAKESGEAKRVVKQAAPWLQSGE